MVKKIALEEHFMCPDMHDYFAATLDDVPAPVKEQLISKLSDLGAGRLAMMDEAGIEVAVISLAGPGVQVEPDTATAVKMATRANDYLAENIAGSGGRLRGFAHLPLQDPKAAANELARCVKDLGFVGALVNGQTHGKYLDHPDFYPVWEMAEALNAPIYLHPADPEEPVAALSDQPMLQRATWGWMVETGSHAMRILFSDVFHRFPGAQLVLGHMGETIPYQLWRIDSRAKLYNWSREEAPSDIIKRNLAITISGVYSLEPLTCSMAALGDDRVMFAADHPFEDAVQAGKFVDTVKISAGQRDALAYKNASRMFGIEI